MPTRTGGVHKPRTAQSLVNYPFHPRPLVRLVIIVPGHLGCSEEPLLARRSRAVPFLVCHP